MNIDEIRRTGVVPPEHQRELVEYVKRLEREVVEKAKVHLECVERINELQGENARLRKRLSRSRMEPSLS